MAILESHCRILDKRVVLVRGESLPNTVDSEPTWGGLICLDRNGSCLVSPCPIAAAGSPRVTHRLRRRASVEDAAPIADECSACGARTIHDRVVGRYAICRACGAARQSSASAAHAERCRT